MFHSRYRRGLSPGAKAGLAAAALVFVAGHTGAGASVLHRHNWPAATPPAARRAIAYARAQIGKPYVWGGTGPYGYDCSGLVMEAYASAGVRIPRTSQDQWAAGRKVPARDVRAGDLAFFVGSDGTMTSPGHVAMVIGRKGTIIEAYATGYPIRYSDDHRSDLVGFTRPAGGA